MKKQIKMLCAATVLSCCLAFPALADMNRPEYNEATTSIRNELSVINDEMAPLKAQNKEISDRYNAVRKERKESGTLTVSKEEWQKIKELRKNITELKKNPANETARIYQLQARIAVKENNYDSALDQMNKALDAKRSSQDSLEQINQIWQQIDALLN